MKREEIEELEDLEELEEFDEEEVDDEDIDDDDEDVDDEDEDDEDDDEDEKPKKKKGKKSKKPASKGKKIIISVVVALLVAGIVIASVMFLPGLLGKGPAQSVSFAGVSVDMDGVRYIGNEAIVSNTYKSKFDAKTTLGLEADDTVAINGSASGATLMGNDVMVSSTTGSITLDMTTAEGKVTQTFTILEAVNVSTRNDLVAALASGKNVVLQSDIKLNAEDYLTVTSNIYGNGFMIDGTDVVPAGDKDNQKYYRPILNYTPGQKCTLQDLHIVGLKVEEGQELQLDIELSKHGIPVVCSSGAEVDIIHCVIENSHRGVYIESGCNVLIQGCIIRNQVDANISLETADREDSPTNITLRNNVLANAGVSGVLIWGYTAVAGDEQYNHVKIEGFLDVYNWKGTADTQMMPATEAVAGMANKIIQNEVAKDTYNDFVYFYEGQKYIHCAIIIIATGGLKGNDPVIEGKEGVNFTERQFPLPKAAGAFINVCKIVSYESDAAILPGQDILDNVNILRELREGR